MANGETSDSRCDLHVRRMDYCANDSFDEHEHDETQITLFLSGQAEEWVKSGRRLIGPMDIVIKPAGLRHANCFGRQGARTIQFSIRSSDSPNKTRSSQLLDEYKLTFSTPLNIRFLQLAQSICSGSPLAPYHLRQVESLLNEVVAQCRVANPSSQPDWLLSVHEDLERNFVNVISVSRLAKKCGRHPVSVARAYRQHFGVAVKERVQELRVKLTAQLLADVQLSVASVSHRCGFSDQSHLSRIFKRYTGITPGQFRRLILGN